MKHHTQATTTLAAIEACDRQWAAAISSGAPPFERLRHPAFRAASDPSSGAAEARRWMDAVCGGDVRWEAALLTACGLNRTDVDRAFGPARIEAGEPLPEWAACLAQTVRALPERSPRAGAGDNNATAAATRVLFDAAAQLLDWSGYQVRPGFLDPQVLVSLTRQLATRVVLACGATVELENITRTSPVYDFSRGAWLERLCGFTGLNFVVGTAIRQWRQNAIEIVTRASRGLPVLEQTLLRGASPGPLVDLELDLGDRHNDGRSVAILTFASGRRVVYKPKDSRSAYHFLDLLSFLNASAGSVQLPARQIICRGSYAWEEYVEQREAASEAEAAGFFRKYGMFLRVLQLVEGRDFWIDNLRVRGDDPVFIDLECILHPRFRNTGIDRRTMGLDPALYNESVLPTAAVTHSIDIPGQPHQDFGGLSAPGSRVLPLGAWSGYRDRQNGDLSLRGGLIYWEPPVAWPRTAGKLAEPVEYLDNLETGYRDAHRLLSRCAAGLRGDSSPLAGMGEAPVRVLMRSTWEYLVLLRASLEPNALLDGNARELALTSVLATAPAWGIEEDAHRRLTIARSELDALRVLDIPEFYSSPTSTSVMDTADCAVTDVFEGSAWDRMELRLAGVDSFDMETHVRILRSAVHSMARAGVGAATAPGDQVNVR